MSKNNLCALILAGGKGTRFWPLSTEEKPKQFLNLIGDKTMIQMTIDRIIKIIPIERIFVCTVESYVDIIKEQLPELPIRNIIVEPEGRNTAPCIALSAFIIKRYYGNATMVVLPSDHLINNEEKFRSVLLKAENFIEKNSDSIVTLGIEPTRAETGYGYIKYKKNEVNILKQDVVKVEKFVEKPNKELAEEYVAEKNYLWNAGMFIWKIENILNNIKKYSVNTFEALYNIEYVEERKLQSLINERYNKTEAISIDYAVLEKANNIYVIPSRFGWDDIGSWSSVERYATKDKNNNIFLGNIINSMAFNNIIISNDLKVVVDGISDIYVISKDNKIFVGKKERIDKIIDFKKLVQ